MCELCSDNDGVREAGRVELRYRAEMFHHFANELGDMAAGRVAPHNDEAEKMREHALVLARYLMQEWV